MNTKTTFEQMGNGLISKIKSVLDIPAAHEAFEERAAIVEIDGKNPRRYAEQTAFWDTIRRFGG